MSAAQDDDNTPDVVNPLAAEDATEQDAAEEDDEGHWGDGGFDVSLIILHLFEDPKFFDAMGLIKGAPFKLASAIIIWSINVLIVVSTFAFCIETYGKYSTNPHKNPEHWETMDSMWLWVEVTCVFCFTVDLGARFIGSLVAGTLSSEVALEKFGSAEPRRTYIELFFRDPMNYIDVLAIFPFYIKLIYEDFIDLRFIRVVRLVRILKSLPGFRHGNTIALISNIVTNSAGALFIPIYFMSLCCIVLSSLVYYVETVDRQTCILMDGTHIENWDSSRANNPGCVTEYGCACPGELVYILPGDITASSESFSSIPDTLWWCVVTFTTVGYGDLSPATEVGRLWACATMVTGVFFLAMPIAIVGGSFERSWKDYSRKKATNIYNEKLQETCANMQDSTEGDDLSFGSLKNNPELVALVRDREEFDTEDAKYDHVTAVDEVIRNSLRAAEQRLRHCRTNQEESGNKAAGQVWSQAEGLLAACVEEWTTLHSMLSQIQLASEEAAE